MGKENDVLKTLQEKSVSRRSFMKGAVALGAMASVYGCSKDSGSDIIYGGGLLPLTASHQMTYIIQKLQHIVMVHPLTTAVVVVLLKHRLHQTAVSFVFLQMKVIILVMVLKAQVNQ